MSGQRGDYRSPLAGVTAGAMAVLVFGIGGLWMVWHKIQGPVGTMVLIIFGSVTGLAVAVALYGSGRLLVLMLLHVREPETARFTIRRRAPVLAAEPVRPGLLSQPVAELPPGGSVIHNHFHGSEAAEAAMRALGDPADESR